MKPLIFLALTCFAGCSAQVNNGKQIHTGSGDINIHNEKATTKQHLKSFQDQQASQKYALGQDEEDHERKLTELAHAACRSELVEGADYTLKTSDDGSIVMKLEGERGTFIFSKAEWTGRQRVLRTDQAKENINYRGCVKEERRFLRKSYRPPM